jgi:hypothetical protein|uniref:Uncharacterized protein n=1 Tax=Myoviridae sp. ctqfO1 TaxID=2827710 RepID=A0A8S5T2U8_9CAUD|nr:MAG TPA: hypothetical protein [Myoviridae sp. ctqfO1]
MTPPIDINNSRAVLFVTNSPDKVKQFLTPLVDNNNFFDFPTCSRETIITITRIYEEESAATIFLHEIIVPTALALLKPLEDCTRPIRLFAVAPSTDDVPPPLLSRFRVVHLDREVNPLAREFLATKTLKTIPCDLSFYVDLAGFIPLVEYNINHDWYNVNTSFEKNIKNLELIGAILRDISLCTHNIFWKYHFDRLKRCWIWD